MIHTPSTPCTTKDDVQSVLLIDIKALHELGVQYSQQPTSHRADAENMSIERVASFIDSFHPSYVVVLVVGRHNCSWSALQVP